MRVIGGQRRFNYSFGRSLPVGVDDGYWGSRPISVRRWLRLGRSGGGSRLVGGCQAVGDGVKPVRVRVKRFR